MDFSKAFDKTLEKHGITGKWLKEASGVSEQMISNFRNGKKQVWTDSLERMIEALPIEAQQYFFESLLSVNQGSERLHPNLEQTIEEMETGALASVLSAIADRLSSRTSDSTVSAQDRIISGVS